MKLFHSGTSPFVRKVSIALRESGLLDKVEHISVAVSPFAPGDDVPAQNPLGKVPCMVLDDGTPLYDSRVICRYLDDLAPTANLYPKGEALWAALTLEATADGIMDAAVSMAYEQRTRPEDKVFDGWLDAQWLKIDRTMSVLESKWMPALNGTPNLPVLSIAAALQYIDMRHDERNWRGSHPVLAAWLADIADRPSLAETVPG